MSVITVSRQMESLGDEVGRLLSERLGFRLITKEQVLQAWMPAVRAARRYGVNAEQAEVLITRGDRRRRRYIHTLFQAGWVDPPLYHMIVNADSILPGAAVELIIPLTDLHKNAPAPSPGSQEYAGDTSKPPRAV